MSVPAAFQDQLFTRKLAAFSGSSLIIYDYLCTFPLEVEYIWNAPWTTIKIGFLLNRYGNLIGQTLLTTAQIGLLRSDPKQFCEIYSLLCKIFALLSGESIRMLVLMRAWAIWGCTYRVTVFLVTLYTLYMVAVSASMIYPQTMIHSTPYLHLEQVHVCIIPILPNIWLTWFATLALDTVVLVMVGHSLWKLFRESRDFYSSPLIHLLVRDAVLFYAASIFNNMFSMICWSMFRTDPRSLLQLALSIPLLSVVGQRLILNLRGFQGRRFTTRDISREVDRQMAAMGDLCWPDLEANDGQANESQNGSEGGDTNDTIGTVDLDLDVIVAQRDQREDSPVPVTRGGWEVA